MTSKVYSIYLNEEKIIKSISKFPTKIQAKLLHETYELQYHPPRGDILTLKNLFLKGKPLQRKRVGDFRIIFIADDDEEWIEVHKIIHRKEGYKRL